MISTRKRLQGFVEKRILTEEGWIYFCSDCNEYHDETKFYKQKDRPYGIMSTCSHAKRGLRDKNPDKTLSHLKFGNITEEDIEGTIDLLETLGYNTFGNVHEQFLKRHNGKINQDGKRLSNPK